MASKFEKKIDLKKFSRSFTNELTQELTETVLAFAKRRVAVDTGELKGSLRIAFITATEKEVFTAVPYAAAQEYGLAPYGKPAYRFRPYMRPAASEAATTGNLAAISRNASRKAESRSQV